MECVAAFLAGGFMRRARLVGLFLVVAVLVVPPVPARGAIRYAWLGDPVLSNPYFRSFLVILAGLGFHVPPVGDGEFCDIVEGADSVCRIFENIAEGAVGDVERFVIDVLDRMGRFGYGLLFPSEWAHWLGPLYNGWSTCAAGDFIDDGQGVTTINCTPGTGFRVHVTREGMLPDHVVTYAYWYQYGGGEDTTENARVCHCPGDVMDEGCWTNCGFTSGPAVIPVGTYYTRTMASNPFNPGHDVTYQVMARDAGDGTCVGGDTWGFRHYVRVCSSSGCPGTEGISWRYVEVLPVLQGLDVCSPDPDVDEDTEWWQSYLPVVVRTPSEAEIRDVGVDREDWVGEDPPDYVTDPEEDTGPVVDDTPGPEDPESTWWDRFLSGIGDVWREIVLVPGKIVAAIEDSLERWFVPSIDVGERLTNIRTLMQGRFPLVVVSIAEDVSDSLFADTCVPLNMTIPAAGLGEMDVEIVAPAQLTAFTLPLSRVAGWIMMVLFLVSSARRFLFGGGG